MSRATLYVRFPDGTLRYGIYNGTSDIARSELTDTPQHAWGGYQDDVDPGPDEAVDIASDYGGGFAWKGTATRTQLTSGHDMMEADADSYFNSLPDWAVYPKKVV